MIALKDDLTVLGTTTTCQMAFEVFGYAFQIILGHARDYCGHLIETRPLSLHQNLIYFLI